MTLEMEANGHVLNILKTVAEIAQKRVVQMLKHASFSDNIANAFGPHHYLTSFGQLVLPNDCDKLRDEPSSFRMYFKAKVKPESFRSTILTLPNAPLPTTRRRRK